DAVLEAERGGGGEGVHEAGDGGAFFGHADEDLAGLAVGVEADGDVALVAANGEFVGDGGTLGGQAVADGDGRGLGVECVVALGNRAAEGFELRGERGVGLLELGGAGGGGGELFAEAGGVGGGLGIGGDERGDCLGGPRCRSLHTAFGSGRNDTVFFVGLFSHGDVEGLGALGAVAVDGDGLEAEAPGFGVGLGDVVCGAVGGEVDGLGDGAGEEGLGGGHHLDVTLPGDGAGALGGLEGAVEDGEVLGLDGGRAFDG